MKLRKYAGAAKYFIMFSMEDNHLGPSNFYTLKPLITLLMLVFDIRISRILFHYRKMGNIASNVETVLYNSSKFNFIITETF